ncbi:Hsp70 family protein [Pseudarthrobacter sp. ATCC 49987]|uniref:Hsp70 family protein n=1 Tax=Pseudarthrobacter sp. ATCC 49987 TaxID=2698204 RepID=UPI0013701BF3|nr:Hsp70 family protein [Pseudarthrobacter sp. ATCC 49987]
MEEIPWRLAIDFGTSNTAAAVAPAAGSALVLRLGTRSDAIPSCVAAYNGEILTGDAARQIAGIYPAAFEPTPKRRLGEDAVVLGDAVFDPVDLVAAVLRFVVGQAIRFVGGGFPFEVVLTHPESWDEYLKGRLSAAAVKAGIPEEGIVLMAEPIAAGWHYAASSDVGVGAHVAVLDFGGGTCDAAVLEFAETPDGRAFRVVASAGIDPLGGHDFDAQLENWVYAQLAAEGKTNLLQGLASERSSADKAALKDQVREAKHALSFHGAAPIGVRSGGHEWVCTVTRAEFEQLIDGQIGRAVELVQRVIQEALPSSQQLHRVYLTGGSSHIPALQARLGEILPMKLGLMGDPKQITSVGALEAPASSGISAGPGGSADAALGGADGAGAGDGADQPGAAVGHQRADVPAAPPRGRKPSRLTKRILIGGGVSAAVVLLGTAIALAGGFPFPPNPLSSATSQAPTSRKCAGEVRPRLTDGECTLLTTAASRGQVSPDSCAPNKNLVAASFGLVCEPPADSGFNAMEKPQISVYGYATADAMNAAFDDLVQQYGAAERAPENPPGWQDWSRGDSAVKGRILGASKDGENYLVWNDQDSLVEYRAVSAGADVPRLHEWWTTKW